MKSRVLGCVGTLLALSLMASTTLAASTLRRMELSAPAADSARLVLDLSSIPARKVFTVEKAADKPDRIVIDLSATKLATGARLPQGAGPVRAVRSGAQPGKTLRLVVELSRKLEPAVSVNGSQLVINIGAVPKQSAATSSAPASTPAVVPQAPPPPAAVRAVHAPDDTGRDIIVAVDAGHGGEPGAIGAKGTREKDVTLAIARALAKRIDAEPGMRAYLTRKDDRYIALRERINLARSARADIFVSIHADSFPGNRDVAGSSVYVLSEKGASSEAARLLAQHENAVDLKGGISLRGMDDQTASLLVDVSQGASKVASLEMAERVLSHLDRVGTVRKTRVQQAGFAVLKLPDIPSMLVETAYISNPAEEKKLNDPVHQAAIAEAIFNGVREHFRTSPPDGTLFARQRMQPGITPVMAGSTGP